MPRCTPRISRRSLPPPRLNNPNDFVKERSPGRVIHAFLRASLRERLAWEPREEDVVFGNEIVGTDLVGRRLLCFPVPGYGQNFADVTA